ncbi:MAG: SGNH/GDSL hydrolase family protein [Candidatus Brocadiia bacterium]
MLHTSAGLLTASVLAAVMAVAVAGEEQPSRWEQAIRRMEEHDTKNPPPKGAILICGSSSARGWDVEKYFPDLDVVNRGFGGSRIADSTHFADRIILPLEPRVIVLYAGDNDIASGKSPRRVLADFQQFVRTVHDELPGTRIVFISIKPSIRRWHLVDKMREANRLIREFTTTDRRLDYVDIDTPMVGEDGKPRPELLADDGLHLSPEGYKLWTERLLPYLKPRDEP